LITLSKFIFIILMSKHQGPKVLGEERMDWGVFRGFVRLD
jgi:hypothetical protein